MSRHISWHLPNSDNKGLYYIDYVYLSDGRMLNEEIVKAGYATLKTVPPNAKYQQRFWKAYRGARENNRGLWRE
jgi:micrococcal nuclease